MKEEATVTITVKELMDGVNKNFEKFHEKLDEIAKKGEASDNRSKMNRKLLFSLGFLTLTLAIFFAKELMQHLGGHL